ncbi:uncharacterized protein LOC134082750 [Sardina pilchardus]|uniref:uncharacterized protein LOC134082750 n=1 Tax=Sardina pilchardus TaxID=27697 RepID=UPI002E0D3144
MVARCFDAGLLLTLFLSVDLSVCWEVRLPHGPLHAAPNSSVVLPCSYDFPERDHYKVTSEMWCLGESQCITQRYVYHSAGIFPEPAYQGRVEYLGRLGSGNCSIRISALTASDSGVYVFRFITDHPLAKLPGQKGIALEISVDLSVSWEVRLPHGPLHAAPNSSVVLPCSYDFPERDRYKVTSEMWCLGESQCLTQRYVYHSAGIFPEPAYQGRVEYLGRLGSGNCSIRISALTASDSGVYVFRFITDHPLAKLPGQKGIALEISGSPYPHDKDTENVQASKWSLMLWILGLLLATTVGAAAVLYCIRTRKRSYQTVSINMT